MILRCSAAVAAQEAVFAGHQSTAELCLALQNLQGGYPVVLGNSFCRAVVDRQLIAVRSLKGVHHPAPAAAQVALFAGRRSTDKLYLTLQNAYCAHALDGYAGTSSVYALEILDRVLGRRGIDEQRRQQMLGETSSITVIRRRS